jgi:hypothetical protein
MALPVTLRRTIRRLLHAPLFTSVAIVTLGLGIGANVAIFSVVNGVLLQPLPFHDAGRLVGVWHSAPGLDIPLLNQSPATYFTYREEGRAFEDIGLWDDWQVSVTGTGEPERVSALAVTDGVLGILRVEAAIGRRFTKEDDAPGAPDRVMLSHAYWQRKFSSDPGVVGRLVTVDGKPREVIGVLPEGFRFLRYTPQLLIPFQFDRAKVRVGNFSYQGVARLRDGVTLEAANADVARMLPMHIERFPMPEGLTKQMFEETRMAPNVRPLAQDVIGDVGSVLWVLLGTVAIVFLIACANVANLFLVRAEGRQQELAIHAALGASRQRITWQLLSESLTLAAAGGLLGLGLAAAGAEGGRTGVERRPVAPSGAQCARGCRDRARGRAAGRLGTDDADLRGDAPGAPRLREPAGGPDGAHLDSGVTDRGSGAGRTHARTDCPADRADPRRGFGRPVHVDHDGRQQQRRPDLRGGLPHGRRSHSADPALQVDRGRLLRNDGQSGHRRTADHLERHLHARTGRRHHREPRA